MIDRCGLGGHEEWWLAIGCRGSWHWHGNVKALMMGEGWSNTAGGRPFGEGKAAAGQGGEFGGLLPGGKGPPPAPAALVAVARRQHSGGLFLGLLEEDVELADLAVLLV